MHVEAFIIAISLDFIIGDPQFRWHPVRCVGALASYIERACRALPFPAGLQGAAFFFLTVSLSLLPVLLLEYFLAPYRAAAIAVEAAIVYFSLGGTCLAREVSSVADELERKDDAHGREKIQLLVSRDAGLMSEEEIASAAIETLSENFSDSAVATLLYAAIGGAPLAWLHRTINTLDAMVGYKNDRYIAFGKLSAKIDDVFGYLPSRLSSAIVCLVAGGIGGDVRLAWGITMRQARLLESPNSGWPIASFAGALRIMLCGPAVYFGVLKQKPLIGIGQRPGVYDVRRALVLYWNSYAAAAALALTLLVAIQNFMAV